MYSWEIQKILEEYNYQVPPEVYLKITDVKSNPQIAYVHYSAFDDNFTIVTLDNYKWTFSVK